MPRREKSQREGHYRGANTSPDETDDLEPNGDLGLGDALELLLEPSRKQAREDKDRQWERISEAFRHKDVSGFLDRHQERLFETLQKGVKQISLPYLTALNLIQITIGPDPFFLELLPQMSQILKNPDEYDPALPSATLLSASLIVFVSGDQASVSRTLEFAQEFLRDEPTEPTLLSLALLLSLLKPEQTVPLVASLVPELISALSETLEQKIAAAINLGLLAHHSYALEFADQPIRKHPNWQKIDHDRLKYAIQNWSESVAAWQKQRHRALFTDLLLEQQNPTEVEDDFSVGDTPIPVRGWINRARLAVLRHILSTGFLHHALNNNLFASIIETQVSFLGKGDSRAASRQRDLNNSRQRNDDRRRKYDAADEDE